MNCFEELTALRQKYGTSEFDHVVKRLSRQRLQNYKRDQRKKFPSWLRKRLYDKQSGICRVCERFMSPKLNQLEIDHIDPNREDFNNEDNLQLVHWKCNRNKGAKSIQEQSKETGETFVALTSPMVSV